jgi:predicted transcriptional regulator
MKTRRVFRANRQTPAQREAERAFRDEIQRRKPSLEDLIRSGECDPDAVMTMGMYFDIQRALQSLKRDRQSRGLSIGDVAANSGLDRAVVSRLENGKQDNPTVATLMRYAAAIGKRFLWSYDDVETQPLKTNGKSAPRRSKRSA